MSDDSIEKASIFKAEIIGDLNTEGPNIYDVPFEETPAAHALKAVGVGSFFAAGGGLTTVSGGIGVFLRSILVRSIPALAAGCIEDRGMVGDDESDASPDAAVPSWQIDVPLPNFSSKVSSACELPLAHVGMGPDNNRVVLSCQNGLEIFSWPQSQQPRVQTFSFDSREQVAEYRCSAFHPTQNIIYAATIANDGTAGIHVLAPDGDSFQKVSSIKLERELFERCASDYDYIPGYVIPLSVLVAGNHLFVLATDDENMRGEGDNTLIAQYELDENGQIIGEPVTYLSYWSDPVALYPVYDNAGVVTKLVLLHRGGLDIADPPRSRVVIINMPLNDYFDRPDPSTSFSLGVPVDARGNPVRSFDLGVPPTTLVNNQYLVVPHADPGFLAVVDTSITQSYAEQARGPAEPYKVLKILDDDEGKISFVVPYPNNESAVLVVSNTGVVKKVAVPDLAIETTFELGPESQHVLSRSLGGKEDSPDSLPTLIAIHFVDGDPNVIRLVLTHGEDGKNYYQEIRLADK